MKKISNKLPKHKLQFKCPSCNLIKELNEISMTVNTIKELREKKALNYYINVGDDLFSQTPLDEFEWACNECLGRKRAISANVELQKYVDNRPYLAYFDSSKSCSNCENYFVFSKEEKKFWYEELNFWVQSKPNKCLDCRKEARKYKVLSKLLLNGKEVLSKEQLEEVIRIYDNLGKEDKVKYYKSYLSKKENWL